MPSESALRRGPHRDFVEELFGYYRDAGRPTLRSVAKWIAENEELAGTASPETVRRVLVGKVQPTWSTAQAILHAMCALAGRKVNELRWPDDYRDENTATLESNLRRLWNEMIDDDPLARPTPVNPLNDPWATPTGSVEEPPF